MIFLRSMAERLEGAGLGDILKDPYRPKRTDEPV
jgi:hypothetical protein